MALSYKNYTGDGSTTDFNVTFDYLSRSHVLVLLNGVETTAFTWLSDNQIRITPAPANGVAIRIKRATPRTDRLVNFQNGSTLNAESDLDADSNQLFFLTQEAYDNTVDVVAPDGSISTEKLVDGATTTAKIADANITNAKLANMARYSVKGRSSSGTGDPEDVDVNDLSVVSAGSTTRRGLSARFADIVNVRDFGAVGNGVADDTAAIQAALDSIAAAGGGCVQVPPGQYRLSATLRLGSRTRIEGSGSASWLRALDSWTGGNQTVIRADRDSRTFGDPFIGVAVRNLRITGQTVGGGAPSHVFAAVDLSYCYDSEVSGCIVDRADDAAIRISGYRPGATDFSYPSTDFGYAERNIIRDNVVGPTVYIGIELVGGAQAKVYANEVVGATQHGIRLAGGGCRSQVTENVVANCEHTALYLDQIEDTVCAGNILRSSRSTERLAVSLGELYRVAVVGNVIENGNITDYALANANLSRGVHIAGNVLSGGSLALGFTRGQVGGASTVEARAVRTATRSRAANVATVVTYNDHGLATGDSIYVVGMGAVAYDGAAASVTVVDERTFTYTNAGADEAATADVAGTIFRTYQNTNREPGMIDRQAAAVSSAVKAYTVTADAGTDTITATGHTYAAGNVVFFSTTTTLPGGLTAGRPYYVVNPATNTFQVSLSLGGAVIDITSTGTGTHTATLGQRFFSIEVPNVNGTAVVLDLQLLNGRAPSSAVGGVTYAEAKVGLTKSNGAALVLAQISGPTATASANGGGANSAAAGTTLGVATRVISATGVETVDVCGVVGCGTTGLGKGVLSMAIIGIGTQFLSVIRPA